MRILSSRFMISIALAVGIALCDQWVKIRIVDYFQQGQPTIPLTPFWTIILTWNHGISFGLLQGIIGRWVLSAIGLLITGGLLVWLKHAQTQLQALSLGLIIGGAIGNLIDRFWHGAVVDYLLFHSHGFYFPAFNIADAAISIGVALLFYEHFLLSSSKASTRKR